MVTAPNWNKDRLVEQLGGLLRLGVSYAPAACTVIRQFSVIFYAIPFMSDSSDYVYIQRRGYEMEYRLVCVEIRYTSAFMEHWILAEMG